MSFNTLWGSSTRQDHPTFMSGTTRSRDSSKQSQQNNPTTSGSAAISYAIGAATTSPTRSPKKSSTRLLPPLSSSRNSDASFAVEIPYPNDAAAERHLRLSQIHEARIQAIPEPKGTIKDTSVNIASAFHQAATVGMPVNGKSLSVSGSSRNLARGPSVDRLGAPKPPSSRGRPQPQGSGDEREESSAARFMRAVSPLSDGVNAAMRAVSPSNLVAAGSTLLSSASSLVRPQSVVLREPTYQSFSSIAEEGDSYDYAAEEALADTLGSAAGRGTNGTKANHNKRKPVSKGLHVDSRAYKPPQEDYESESSEDEKRRPKKGIVVQRALLTGVPSMTTKKRSKRKSGSGITAVSEDGSIILPRSDSQSASTAQAGPSRQGSQQPLQQPVGNETAEIMEVEEEIIGRSEEENDSSIEEIQGHQFEDDGQDFAPSHHRISIGQQLGKMANTTVRLGVQVVGMVLVVILNTLSVIYELVVTRPMTFLSGGFKEMKVASDILNLKTLALVALLFALLYNFIPSSAPSNPALPHRSWFNIFPGFQKRPPVYTMPDLPAGSVDEWVDRLRLLEGAFVNLEADHRQAVDEYRKGLHQIELDSRAKDTMVHRVMAMETKLEGETRRAMIAEENDRAAAKRTIGSLEDLISSIKGEVAALKGAMAQQASNTRVIDPRTDERIGVLEKELRDVSERIKTAIATERKEHVKHVSADGKDLTQLVQNIISTGGVSKPDFALYYAGATVEPRMTSKTLAIRHNWIGKDTRGRPPVTALVPDITVGNCWPFAGQVGQLGIRLSRIIHLSHVTIDHPPHDVLFDEKSAPRQFHVWLAVEGPENLQKVDAFEEVLDEKRAQGLAPALPTTPFGLWRLLHVGTFEYDVHASSNTQTFEIPKEYQNLKIDTGAVVVDFASNWGNADHTCVYRVRVHGTQVENTSQ